MTFNLHNKKKETLSFDSSNTFKSKKLAPTGAKRLLSTQSIPSSYRYSYSNSDTDHSSSYAAASGYDVSTNPQRDVENVSEPAYISQIPIVTMVANDDDLTDSKSLESVYSQESNSNRVAKIQSPKKKHSSASPSFLSVKRRKSQEDQYSQNDVSGHRPGHDTSIRETESLNNTPKNSIKKQHISSPHQIKEHMAHVESTANFPKNSSGFFSNLVHVAQNAANQLMTTQTTDDLKLHPPKNTLRKPEVKHSDSFMHHLDSLLLKEQLDRNPSHETQDDNLMLNQEPSLSVAHNVHFKPVRETILNTMGKGELSLEDFGFDDVLGSANGNARSINRERSLSLQADVPQIETSADNSAAIADSNDFFLKNSDQEIHVEADTSKSSIPPITSYNSNVSTVGSVYTQNMGKSLERKGGTSPFNSFRRSLSPSGLIQDASKQTNLEQPFNKAYSKSISSGIADTSVNGSSTPIKNNYGLEISPAISISNESIDLRNISFASVKRNNEFHNLFKSIPQSERLINDFNCAFQKKFLVQGKIYVSEYHLSFKSNILGWVTNLTIPTHEVVQVEKKTTAGLFHNAIVIQTLHQKYIFTSFLQRDTVFELIFGIWSQLVRGSLFEDSNVNVNIDLEDLSRQQSYDSYGSVESEGNEEEEKEEEEDDDLSEEFESDHDANDLESLDVTAPMKHEPTEPDHEEHSNETKITEKLINAPLPKIYNLLFGDDTSTLEEIIQKQKNYDVSTLTGFKDENGVKLRYYEYIKPLNGLMGPKSTLCKITETLEHYDLNDYVKVSQITKSPDVPSGNSFVVNTSIYLSWGPNNSTKISVYTYVEWFSKSWIKAAVEKGTISGQVEAIGILVDELIKVSKSGSGISTKVISEDDSSDEEGLLPTVGPKTHAPTSIDHEIKSSETLIVDEVLNAPLGTIYYILFGDDTSFMKSIIAAQKNTKISEITGFKSEGSAKKRTYNYIKPLSGSIGPKATKCLITETIEVFDLDKYIQVVQTAVSPDVPSGSSFTVSTSIYLSWAESNSTRLYVVTEINWTSRSWIKGIIEKSTIDGQKESLGILLSEVKNILKHARSGGKKKRKRAKTRAGFETSKRLTEEETKPKTPQKETEFSIQNVIDLVLKHMSNPISVIGLLFIFFLVFYLIFKVGCFVFGKPTQYVTIENVSHVDINGQKYMLVPSFDDVIQSRDAYYQVEFDIWSWINDRKKDDTVTKLEKPTRVRSHSDQDLIEMVKLTERHLSVLKQELNGE